MAPVVMKRLAPGTELEQGPTGHQLSWPEGEATFYYQYKAVTFSWVIGADPAAIVASYQHPNGEPLFDLGVPAVIESPGGGEGVAGSRPSRYHRRTRKKLIKPPSTPY
jgi:hypothetical protein